jgi:hypothetical protein
MTQESESQTSVHPIARLLSIALGVGVGWYSGMALIIPAAIGILAVLVLSKALPSRHLFNVVGGVTIGHIGWMVIGASLTGNWGVIIDALLLGGLVCWLLARPGLTVVVLLCGAELVEITYCALRMISAEVGTTEHKALVVHLVLYAIAFCFLILGYIGHRRAKASERQLFTE